MAQANNRGFNQDYSCANSREFLPYFLLVSHWMPEWIWAKQGWQMGNKNWSKIWQRLRIQPVMRQFDVCSAKKRMWANTSWKKLCVFILWKHLRLSSVHRWVDKTRGGQFFFETPTLFTRPLIMCQSQALTTQIILIWLNLYQFPSGGG